MGTGCLCFIITRSSDLVPLLLNIGGFVYGSWISQLKSSWCGGLFIRYYQCLLVWLIGGCIFLLFVLIVGSILKLSLMCFLIEGSQRSCGSVFCQWWSGRNYCFDFSDFCLCLRIPFLLWIFLYGVLGVEDYGMITMVFVFMVLCRMLMWSVSGYLHMCRRWWK